MNENVVFLVGGYSSINGYDAKNYVQKINFEGVETLDDAKSEKWVMLGALESKVDHAAVQYINDKLFIFGNYQSENIQYFDVGTNVTGTCENVIRGGYSLNGLRFPGSYIRNSEIHLVGGFEQFDTCLDQFGFINNIDRKWSCENSTFEGLVYENNFSQTISYVNIFDLE